jgi:hypothetical protein
MVYRLYTLEMDQPQTSTPPRPTIPASTNAPIRPVLNNTPITTNSDVARVLFK